ncbi:unnamed protein product, partial [Amoebophrya sp. A25]|eukprot:GSA25T00009665001.1
MFIGARGGGKGADVLGGETKHNPRPASAPAGFRSSSRLRPGSAFLGMQSSAPTAALPYSSAIQEQQTLHQLHQSSTSSIASDVLLGDALLPSSTLEQGSAVAQHASTGGTATTFRMTDEMASILASPTGLRVIEVLPDGENVRVGVYRDNRPDAPPSATVVLSTSMIVPYNLPDT